ncbi:MAG TPA: 3-deoxy-7-phosphoheptulonate synthase, partial [Actinoplanes sp.]|nr:3-deoxy-7-phosphoheptulonate synthase [Actinoplanes sp.]
MTIPEVQRVRDQRIGRIVPLMSPALLHHELPLTEDLHDAVLSARGQVSDVLRGRDPRLLVVVGPCSVHDPDAAGEYASRLRDQATRLADDLLVVMRVYFEKPRSTVGWKGLINDPALDGTGDVGTGLRVARKLLLEVVGQNLPVAVEFLDPITPQYIADTVAWGAI